MAKLSMFLPPFAGDYSGAAGVLFGLNSVNVIVDASCCTHNYTSYDEPRWKSRRRATFGAQLRTLEATLGDDSRLLDQTEDAVRELGSPCVALIGSPVPALVGMDLDGMASELEMRCGVPAFGLATTGFGTYELGASAAQELLASRFAEGGTYPGTNVDGASHSAAVSLRGGANGTVGGCAESARGGADVGSDAAGVAAERRINILGITVHDFGSEAAMQAAEQAILDDIGEQLKCGSASAQPVWSTAGGYLLAGIAAAGAADETVVATWSGLAAARLLEQRFGVPMRVGLPPDALRALPGVAAFLDEVASGVADDASLVSRASLSVDDVASDGQASPSAAETSSSLLIVHDQVIANSLRNALREVDACAPIHVASFFSMDPDLAEPGDFHIETEDDLIAYAAENPNVVIAGDPLIRRLPNAGDALRWELPHEAVSCTLYL
jgi:nitrogenase molybdenum-cofactor synthesis protein NifE